MRRHLAALALLLSAPVIAQTIGELQTAATAGDAAAQYRLGEAYRTGQGVAADREAAIGWFRKAAASGDTRAADALGLLLFAKGERRESIRLIDAAAMRGDARALYISATARFNADHVPKDWPRAYAEMKRAAAAGLPQAQRSLGLMEPYMSPSDRARATAIAARPAPSPAPALIPAARPAPPPLAVAASPPPISPVPAAPPPPAPKPASDWRIQLGAYGSADRAETQWKALAGKVGALAPLDHSVTQVNTVWRLQAKGLDRAGAEVACKAVVAAGGACFTLHP